MSRKKPVRDEEDESAVTEAVSDELTFRGWQEALREGRLLGEECGDCGQVTSFPRGACDGCGGRNLSTVELPETGEIYSETSVHVAPEGFEGNYQLALVDLDGTHVLARIDGGAEIGDTVTFADVFDDSGDPAPVFEPVG
jgi:uncharacterized OB-fold protein